MADDLSVERIEDPSQTAWLRNGTDGGWCDFDAVGWPKSTWILHAMYEHSDLPGGLSHDDLYRIERGAAPSTRSSLAAEMLDATTVIGCPDGTSRHPGEGWHRLRWEELAHRLGVHPVAEGRLPSHRSFPHASWPVNLRPPAEGALDREQYRRLIERLAACSLEGDKTECLLRYAPCWDMSSEHVFRGTLRDARHQYDDPPGRRGAPNNLWGADRSWFVFTDYDLWGTKVSGSERLIATLAADQELETSDLAG